MKTKLLTSALFGFLAAFVPVVWASTPVVVGLARISFDTVGGDKVTVTMKDDRVSNIDVNIDAQKIIIPKAAYADLVGPYLNSTVLKVTFGNNGGASYQLEFSLADPNKDYIAFKDMALVSFLIENHKLIERDIYEDQTKTKILSSIKFDR